MHETCLPLLSEILETKFRTPIHLANHVRASSRNIWKFSRKEHFLHSTLTKIGRGRQSTVQVPNSKFDENTRRLVSVVKDEQTEGRGEPKEARLCNLSYERCQIYVMNQYTKLRKIKLWKK